MGKAVDQAQSVPNSENGANLLLSLGISKLGLGLFEIF